jgi:hypothetical protein
MEDLKKLNSVQERKHGTVYGVDKKGVKEFHSIENIPMSTLNDMTLGEVIKALSDINNEQDIKNKKLVAVIERLIERIENLERIVENYGMV